METTDGLITNFFFIFLTIPGGPEGPGGPAGPVGPCNKSEYNIRHHGIDISSMKT